MPELNKFLDLEGLKVFWEQINEKKQNRKIQYKGKEMLLEECLNQLKIDIDNISQELGNIEELENINARIEEIKTTLDEINQNIDSLEENYVPESRTVSGISLENDISAEDLRKNLSTFPIIINNGAPDGNIVKGQPTQFCIDINGNRIFRCVNVNADTGYCHWVEVYVNTSRTIAGLSLKDDVKDTDLHSALLVYPTIMNYVEGAEGKRGQIAIQQYNNNEYLLYVCTSDGTNFWTPLGYINKSKILTTYQSGGTNEQVPSAKLFYDKTQNLQSQFDNLEKTLNYETGIFGTGDTVWYTGSSSNLSYKPYSILNGTYEKIGDYCTASAKVAKVEGWTNIFISLPINPIAPAQARAEDSEGTLYNVATTTLTEQGTIYHVARISRQDGKNMTRPNGDTNNLKNYVEFTIRYKYR